MQHLGPDAGDVTLLASIPRYPDTSEVELTKEVWPIVHSVVYSVTIALETGTPVTNSQYRRLADEPFFPACPETLSAYSEPECSTTVVSLPLDNTKPATSPARPSPFTIVASGSGSVVRKPVIYLYPPSHLSDVTVELLLTSSWSFSAIYPLPQTAITSGETHQIAPQSLTWTVDAEPDGRLVDKTSGVEVSYLYWEATYVMLCYVLPNRD